MSSRQSEEEFKLPLRQWLTKKIEQAQFEGLEWIDDKQQLFKIPWTQKGHPNWEKHYGVFIAWARHRGNYDENNPPDDKKLKGNFRCALNKSDDFEEMKSESRTNQQMGNYKLFKLLTPAEVKAKRESRKRPHPRSNNTPAAHNSLDMPEMKKTMDQKANPGPSAPSPTYVVSPPTIKPVYQDNPSVASPLYPPGPVTLDFDYKENEIGKSYLSLLPVKSDLPFQTASITQFNSMQLSPPCPIDSCSFRVNPIPVTGAVPPEPFEDNLAFLDDILVSPGPATTPEAFDAVPVNPEIVDEPSPLPFESFEEFLHNFNIPSDQLSLFNVSVRYEKEIVYRGEHDLSNGIRLMYGDPEKQKAILEAFRKNLSDFDLKPVKLPTYNGDNRHVLRILQSADLGLLLKLDAKQALKGTRLCQSQVFYFDTKNEGCECTKMVRKEKIELFSFLKCVKSFIQGQRDNSNHRIDPTETVLVIGTKPKHPRSSTLVSVILEPKVADVLREHFSGCDSLLAISQQNSLDQLVRMLDNMNSDISFSSFSNNSQ